MAVRTIPFGYVYENGVRVVEVREAEIIKNVFASYINGDTFDGIAQELNQGSITYAKDKLWGKNIISRMIDDVRYTGSEIYPLIIEKELYFKAKEKRESKGSKKVELPKYTELIKSKSFCDSCKNKYTRRNKWKTREKWICSCGCKTEVYFDDALLFSEISNAINKALQKDILPKETECKTEIEATKKENELSQLIEQTKIDYSVALSLILECANERFSRLEHKDNIELQKAMSFAYDKRTVSAPNQGFVDTSSTNIIQGEAVLSLENSNETIEHFIENTVDKIYIKPDGKVSLLLYGGINI